MKFRTLGVALACLASSACSHTGPGPLSGEWIDLTHELNAQSIFWPTAEEYRHEEVAHGHTSGGWFYSSYNIALSEHGGTHLDAPIHFAEGRQTVSEVPLESLIGPAAVVDVSAACEENRDYLVTVKDLLDWEAANGPLPRRAIVLFRTGFSRFWPDRKAYMGTDLRGEEGVANLHFPGISEELARVLAQEREVAAVGLDTPSLDAGQSKTFMAHRILLEKNIPGFENVTNLDRLPAKGALVFALPVKIAEGSGAPLRIVAMLPGK